MATLRLRRSDDSPHPGWLETFRAADAWVVAVWEAAASMGPGAGELARALRRGALECGAALVAGAQCGPGPTADEFLGRARARLLEARYLLYLTRRFGAVDARRYKTLNQRLERALREVAARGAG